MLDLRLRTLLAAVLTAQLLDLLTYELMIERLGDGAELNLIVRLAYQRFGVTGPIGLKLALIAFVCFVVWLLTRSVPPHPRAALILSALAVVFGLVGAIYNIATIPPGP